MTDRPMIFSAPMIRALLDGRKTQTRRILKNVPNPPSDTVHASNIAGPRFSAMKPARYLDSYCSERHSPANPRGMSRDWCWWTRDDRVGMGFKIAWMPGDRIWVRETHQFGSSYYGPQKTFRATPDYFSIDAWDGPDEGVGPSFNYDKCPCADFSHWLSDVISSDGPWRSPFHMPRWASRLTLLVTDVRVLRLREITHADAEAEAPPLLQYVPFMQGETTSDYIASFAALWNSIHGADAWAADPWVAALTFRVIRANIDAPEARAA